MENRGASLPLPTVFLGPGLSELRPFPVWFQSLKRDPLVVGPVPGTKTSNGFDSDPRPFRSSEPRGTFLRVPGTPRTDPVDTDGDRETGGGEE